MGEAVYLLRYRLIIRKGIITCKSKTIIMADDGWSCYSLAHSDDFAPFSTQS